MRDCCKNDCVSEKRCCFSQEICCKKGEPGPRGPVGPQGPKGPFLSSYVEALGSTQTVNSGANIIFDTTEDDIDIVGNDIEADATGTIFTIRRAGLYHVEWSLNLESGTQPIIVCLMENGEAISPISSNNTIGNISSGALINATENELPITISLHNFGGQISIADQPGFEATAASIRILRFADGPHLG